jgi:hypothetical protein
MSNAVNETRDPKQSFQAEVEWDKCLAPSSAIATKSASHATPATGVASPRTLAIYAKLIFADDQGAVSIERQIAGAERLASAKFGLSGHLLFTDTGRDAAAAHGEGLRALIAAIERGGITDVIVEDFNVLSSSLHGAAEVVSLFEKHDVRLWTVGLQRPSGMTEIFERAHHIENERARRANLQTARDVHLVHAGGMPGGVSFGYEKSNRPGFPVVCRQAAPTIHRMFELLLSRSDSETAQQLTVEGFLPPNGAAGWTARAVRRLRQEKKFVGIVIWRPRERVRSGDGKGHRVVIRPPEEWVVGRNEAYRIVSDQLFQSVQSRHEHHE